MVPVALEHVAWEGGCSMDEDRACHHGEQSELGGPSSEGGADLISALPDDVIILVLVRLRCTRTAVHTGLLSRRWGGLWTHLPDLIFRDVAPSSLLVALSSLGHRGVSLLDIQVPAVQEDKLSSYRVSPSPRIGLRSSLRRRPTNYASSLLRAAARLSPAALRFNHPQHLGKPFLDVDLSACFRHATSIEVHAPFRSFPDPQFELPALQSLSLSGCRVSLAILVPLCPCLHVLRVVDPFLQVDDITVRSSSLQKLTVENNVVKSSTGCILVEAPVLKQFTMLLRTRGDFSVSISTPQVERVSWRCFYSGSTAGLGLWGLSAASLETQDSKGVRGAGDAPHCHVLCLHIFARPFPRSYPDAELGFGTEIEKHMIIDFSGLEVHLKTREHVFGAFLLRLLGMHRIRAATRSLKIVLQRFEMKDRCTPLVNCSCDEPKNWRTQTISLTSLEKVEIKGFEGEDHEFDFLKLIFRCAPMLKTVALELSEGFTPRNDWCQKIHSIFMAYPSVECSFEHSAESTQSSQS
ncbi:unnamed protein product [Alopecurus aequalis]